MKQYRHGDVFVATATIPQGVEPEKGTILAWGEATGHHHKLEPLKLTQRYMISEGSPTGPVQKTVTGKQLLEMQKVDFQGGRKAPTLMKAKDGRLFFRCHNTTALTHQEHGTIVIPPGDYESIIQREYSPEAIRRVID